MMTFKLTLSILLCLLATSFARIRIGMGKPFDRYQNENEPYLGFNLPISSRIVGGQQAERDEFPHQVTLQHGSPPFLSHLCGGSVLNERWVLTAAHCPLAVVGRTLYVKAGKYSIRIMEKSEQLVKVAKSFVHERYPGGVAPFDIALLKLDQPLVFDEHVQPISLPAAGSDVQGDVVLSGWGSVSPNGFGQPEFLQKATLPIVDNKSCKEAIEKLTGYAPFAPSNVCTGPLTGGVSACSGDSGGPLIKTHTNKHSEVIGIVSWGIMPCGTLGAPSVYTRVSSYIDWINDIIESNN